MKIKFQKTMNIASELLAYCHHHGAKEFHLDIMEGNNSVKMVMRACPEDLSPDELDYLKTALSTPRQREVEQGFWELIGESEDYSELQLLGMLCDDADVDYTDRILTVSLSRHD